VSVFALVAGVVAAFFCFGVVFGVLLLIGLGAYRRSRRRRRRRLRSAARREIEWEEPYDPEDDTGDVAGPPHWPGD
jgi:hypothetical protein